MSGDSALVIAGAGLAGAKAAEALRGEGFGGPVVLIGDETERPPLSKDYLLGKAERESVFVHPRSWYCEHDVDLRLGVPVTGVDAAAHAVSLADGSRVGYAKLLLATGSSPTCTASRASSCVSGSRSRRSPGPAAGPAGSGSATGPTSPPT